MANYTLRMSGAAAAFIAALFALTPSSSLAQNKLAKIITVEQRSSELDRVFFGRVRARETVDFAFQVGGQILMLPVEEGQPIREGDLIAELDLEPFELDLATAEATLDQDRDDFIRLSSLSSNVVSQTSVDDAETAVRLSEISLQDAQRSLRLATLKSPFDGILASRQVPNFSTVSAGEPVVRLHDMSDLRVEIEVPEILFQQAGQDPNVSLEVEFPASDKRYQMEFREIDAETSDVGQSFLITLGMAPPEDLFVLPGSSATVYVQFLSDEAPIVIPAAAIVFDTSGDPSVLVFEPTGADSGTVRRTAIEIAPERTGAVQVLSGLEPGLEIVAAGAALLEDGETVDRFTEFAR